MSVQKNPSPFLQEETDEITTRQITPKATELLPEPEVETNQQAEQTIDQLQQAILSDDNFDFSQLEAAGAGALDNTQSADNDGSHLTTPVIEAPSKPTENSLTYTPSSELRSFDTSALDSNEQSTFNNPIIDDSALLSLSGSDSESHFLGDAFANVTEDFLLTVSGKADTNTLFTASTQTTQYGEISYNEHGEWHYTLNNNMDEVQELGAGDILQESIKMIATNGDQFVINVTINGSNDLAFISGTKSGIVKEDDYGETAPNNLSIDEAVIETSGKLAAMDVDAGEARFAVQHDIETNYGKAEINTQGQWRYELNNDLSPVQGLKEGQTLRDHFTANTLDGTSKVIQITIEGSNDTPILKGSNAAQLNLDSSSEASGQLGVEDPDFGESHFQAQTDITGRYGTGSIDESGQWHYQVNSDHPTIKTLDDGTSIFDTFVVLTADNTETQVIIKIDNQPVSGQPAVIELSELENPLTFSISSPDSPEADVYIWNASNISDGGIQDSPETDHISHFVSGDGGDILQLNDLLVDSADENNLEQFLHFSFDGQDTTIEILPEGAGSEGSHFLVLDNINLTSFGNSDGEIIHELINNGNLDIAGL